MQIISQEAEIVHLSCANPLALIEDSARTCYDSKDKTQPGSDLKMVRKLVDKGHSAMIEFADMIVDFTTNRAMSHELVRHRIASFAQQSQRYVAYREEVAFIMPVGYNPTEPMWKVWVRGCEDSARDYSEMLAYGATPQQARNVLNNSCATIIRVKANLREWQHIFSLRCSPAADPQMQALMKPLLLEFASLVPVIYLDLVDKYCPGEKLPPADSIAISFS